MSNEPNPGNAARAGIGKLQKFWANSWPRWMIWFVGVTLLALNLLEFPRQPYHVLHDLSSHATFEYYAARHLQFGQQVYQNIGPYGFVHYAYSYSGFLHARKVLLKAFWRMGLLLLVVWVSRRLLQPGLMIAWWAAFLLLQPVTLREWPVVDPRSPALVLFVELDWDQVYSGLIIYLSSLYLLQRRNDRRFWAACGAVLFLLAFNALTKHTGLVLASCAVVGVSLQKLLRKDFLSASLNILLFFLFLLLLWVLARQSIANLPGFIRGAFVFSSGYSEAMACQESPGTTLAGVLILGLLAARSLYNCFALKQGIGRLLIEAALLYVTWKHGFVRADFPHVALFAFTAMLLVGPLFFARVPASANGPPSQPCSPGLHRVASWSSVAVIGLALTLLSFFGTKAVGAYRPGILTSRLRSNLSWLLAPGRKTAELSARLRETEKIFALPRIQAAVGSARVDYFGFEPGWVLLNGLNYWSRPMPITFAAANDVLERANEVFYRDPQTAPEFVICGIRALDDRCVAQDDALALRALADNYHPVLTEKGLLLLERNSSPLRSYGEKQLIAEFKAPFPTSTLSIDDHHQMLWLEVEIKPSFLGKLRSFLYKPPPCYLLYRFVGDRITYGARFVTTMGGCGCLLSPMISNNLEFSELYVPESGVSGLNRVGTFSLICASGDRKFFQNDVRLRFFSYNRPVLAPPFSEPKPK